MRRNTFENRSTLIGNIVKNVRKKSNNWLSSNSITDLTKVPLVKSCLIRYGNARGVALFNWKNLPGKIHYKFELAVYNPKKHFMV